jgi:putative transposase
MEDECHLLWGDSLGYVWGKKNEKIDIPILNERERQTYYGALNCFTGDFYVLPYSAGNGENTVEYMKFLQKQFKDKKLLVIWDGASYHRFSAMREYLQQINKDLQPSEWKITCELFAPNAPEQNPVEDIWLQGKRFIRKYFTENKTFAQVKKSFCSFYKNMKFDFPKIQMYRDLII